MNKGWAKLYRCSMESPSFKNPHIWKVWTWCIMKATHKDYEEVVGTKRILLKSGEFVFGRFKASAELDIPPATLYDYMQTLKKWGNISIKSGNKYSIITVVNWDFYQNEANKSSNNPGTKSGNKPATNRHKQEHNIFIIPTIEEVQAYCIERNNNVDPKHFIDFYTAKGWMIGKNKMKDWKATVRTWESNSKKKDTKEVSKYEW